MEKYGMVKDIKYKMEKYGMVKDIKHIIMK